MTLKIPDPGTDLAERRTGTMVGIALGPSWRQRVELTFSPHDYGREVAVSTRALGRYAPESAGLRERARYQLAEVNEDAVRELAMEAIEDAFSS